MLWRYRKIYGKAGQPPEEEVTGEDNSVERLGLMQQNWGRNKLTSSSS